LIEVPVMSSPTDDVMQATVRKLAEAGDVELFQTVTRLRTSKQLFNTVHALNEMLAAPEHRNVALRALKRLGLEYCG
jgi:hypothetical protein